MEGWGCSEEGSGCKAGEERSDRWFCAVFIFFYLSDRWICSPALRGSLIPRYTLGKNLLVLSQEELSVARRAGEKSYFDPSLTFYKHSPISLHEEGPVLGWDSIPPRRLMPPAV